MYPLLAFLTGTKLLGAALIFGALFGLLLHRGGVTDYNVIVNQFRFRDFTVLKVMFTAIVVGGVGLFLLKGQGLANLHIKPATMLAVVAGAALFGVGMVLYGYCPGTGVAAVATGKLDALVGFAGMLVGGALYAWAFPWISAHVLPVADFGKKRLPDLLPMPEAVWYAGLAMLAAGVFALVTRWERKSRPVRGESSR